MASDDSSPGNRYASAKDYAGLPETMRDQPGCRHPLSAADSPRARMLFQIVALTPLSSIGKTHGVVPESTCENTWPNKVSFSQNARPISASTTPDRNPSWAANNSAA